MQHVMKRSIIASTTALALLGMTVPALAQTLTIGTRAGPESVDPHYTASGTHAEALKHVFDTLVWSGDKLQLEPRLAESWKPLDDTTWEFKLRKGVKFHDGSDFTAEDVKFSIERIPTVSGPNPTTIYVRRVKETKIIDPFTIHIVTDGPSPTLPNDFIHPAERLHPAVHCLVQGGCGPYQGQRERGLQLGQGSCRHRALQIRLLDA
jgi:peptide/nickel transport system substrate-binding protein